MTGLVAPNVVNTMPQATLDAVADHGAVPGTDLRGGYREAHKVLQDLAELGVDYADIVQHLEDDGVATFDAGWDELGGELATRLDGGGRPSSRGRQEEAKR